MNDPQAPTDARTILEMECYALGQELAAINSDWFTKRLTPTLKHHPTPTRAGVLRAVAIGYRDIAQRIDDQANRLDQHVRGVGDDPLDVHTEPGRRSAGFSLRSFPPAPRRPL